MAIDDIAREERKRHERQARDLFAIRDR